MSGDSTAVLKIKRPESRTDQVNYDRLRQDGVNTLSTLLSESRTENRLLKEKTHDLEKTVEQLTTRLNSSQLSADMSARVQDSQTDVFLSPASKSLMENIIRENSELKRAAELQSDPQQIDELHKRISSLKCLTETLRCDKSRLEVENRELIRIIESTGTDSQRRELELDKRLRQTEEKCRCDRNLCKSYLQQIDNLKDQLAETARHCLNVRNNLIPLTCAPTTTCNNQPITVQSSSQLQVPESIPSALDGVGDKDSGKSGNGNEPNAQPSTRHRQRSSDRRSHQCQLSDDRIDETRSHQFRNRTDHTLVEENKRLQIMLQEKREEIEKLKNHQLALHQQLEVYKEDFKTERLERKNTTERISNLQDELKTYKNKALSQQRKTGPGSINPWDSHPSSSNLQKTAQNSTTDQSARRKETAPPKQNSVRHKQTGNSKVLTCPKCNMEFPENQQLMLVDHLADCQK